MCWCPKCLRKADSDSGRCPACGAALVPELPPQTPVPAADGVSAVERQLLLAVLEEAGIPAFPQVTDPYDAIRRLYCGTILYGETICVAYQDLDRARELIRPMRSGDGRQAVRSMAAEIEAMPLADAPQMRQPPGEDGENPVVKFAVLFTLSIVAVWLLFYLASL